MYSRVLWESTTDINWGRRWPDASIKKLVGGLDMFDYESPKEKEPVDPTDLIIGVILGAVLLLFILLGKVDIGLTVCVILAAAIFAIKLHWDLRKHFWFWAIIAIILALHVPLVFMVRWPQGNMSIRVYVLPVAVVDFVIIWGALDLAERLFVKNPSSNDQNK
jgi:hypothetical protein